MRRVSPLQGSATRPAKGATTWAATQSTRKAPRKTGTRQRRTVSDSAQAMPPSWVSTVNRTIMAPCRMIRPIAAPP
jgi:hypothetical protein